MISFPSSTTLFFYFLLTKCRKNHEIMINICIFVVQTSYLVFKMLKTLLKQVKQYKTASFLTPVFIMLEVVLDVLIPFVTAKLIDNGISAGL